MDADVIYKLREKLSELISRYEKLEQENLRLSQRLSECELIIEEKEEKIKKQEQRISDLLLKEAFLGTSSDRKQAGRKVAAIIEEIDRCIALLSE